MQHPGADNVVDESAAALQQVRILYAMDMGPGVSGGGGARGGHRLGGSPANERNFERSF
jgi:hypothetical protein